MGRSNLIGALVILLMVPAAMAEGTGGSGELPWRVGDQCVVRDSVADVLAYNNPFFAGEPRVIKAGTRLRVVEKHASHVRMEMMPDGLMIFMKAGVLIAQCQVERGAWRNIWQKDAPLEKVQEPIHTSNTIAQEPEGQNIERSPLAEGPLRAEKENSLAVWEYSSWGLAGAGLAAGVSMGIMASRYESEAALGMPGGQRAAQSAQTWAQWANIGYAVAGGGVLAAIVVMSFENNEEPMFGLAPHLAGPGISVVGTW